MGNYSLVSVLLLILSQKLVMAGSCCGGGASLPSLIFGDYQAQIGISATNLAVTHSANASGAISEVSANQHEVNEVYSLLASYQLLSKWQMGLVIPYKYNTKETFSKKEQSGGLGDIKISAAYEFLPEMNFSYYKPRGFIFLEESIPTGYSSYESRKTMRTDSFGKGFYSTSLGVALTKNISNFDIIVMGDYNYNLKRKFSDSSEVHPGNGFTSLISFGYTPTQTSFHFGVGALYSYESSASVKGDITSVSNSKYTTELNLYSSYLFNGFSLMGQYSDQTFWGQSKNSFLTKSLQISLMKFFDL